jgi:hypothetical protein
MRQNMAPQSLEVRPCRLRGGKAQRRQPARCVIDEHDQRAAGAAVFKPGVRTAIDLDQLAKPRTPLTQLKQALLPALLRAPEAQTDLHPANRLHRNRDTVTLQQLLHRQGGAEIGVLVPQQFGDPIALRRSQPVIRRPTTLAGHQAGVPLLLPRPHQPLELPDPDPQTLGRLALGQLFLLRLADQMRAFPLQIAHP